MYRTHHLNELDKTHINSHVTLAGWVNKSRDHGGIVFIDLRDREGITQVVFDPSHNQDAHNIAEKVKNESVIQIKGKVRQRPAEMINTKIKTGEIEILADEIKILNLSETPPFEISQDKKINEELRLKFRYLDLRRERMKNNIIRRHQIIKYIRDYFDKNGFIEVETPILIKGTPEGSREYIVPSRIYPGQFYVLPQSPQQLKQLLMVAGMDRYFQIARCFRDEDQRGDRQPEFTQLDIEMSFVEREDVININEQALIELTEKFLPNKKIMNKPFPRITWQEAMENYGSDKPDIRFDLKIQDISDIAKDCGFQVFENTIKNKGVVKVLKVPNATDFTRTEISELEEIAKNFGAQGLAYISMENNELKSPILKFLNEKSLEEIKKRVKLENKDIVFFVADKFQTTCESLGWVRLACAKKLKLINENLLAYCWVIDFPLFEWSTDDNRLVSAHHPFTSPKLEDIHLLENEPEKVRAIAYDIVLNGNEVGGGSIRIHDSKLQSKIFDILKISKQDSQKRFGHLLKAFTFGAPPHGGIAWGLDRLIMLIQNEPNIREVIAYPKDQKAKDLMTGAPSTLPKIQTDEVHIKVTTIIEEGIIGHLKEYFTKNHIWYEIIDLKKENSDTQVKTQLFKNENDEYFISVTSKDEEINLDNLKKQAKTNKIEKASPDEVEGVTQCLPDYLHPIGNLYNIRTFLSENIKNADIISYAINEDKGIRMKSNDLQAG
ncbi:MAG: Aspartate-tRNA ligase [Candidatus Peregrinibacteria bacterium GW2011_GWA2_33_10]|nr:MAG: Aspartate-tRNA ligase [Candidatus Peregrinibacteria bacterium GW2011_GWA2_33_10]KKP39802.1 MAG: aspartyl-tRNA synthetase, aspartyl-tRNA synthetase [Candidatus Peregrinibacteria bacterium GW2011_GWC2_33_13]OGJ48924.1 MAG: aspartate--tRNA ligase [Candidatus Peregrinibacteria bacterium RIFOXYA2_FULL_33_7]